MTTDENSISTAASAAMEMIDKLNNERFLKLNQINNLFMLTTFYHIGGNLSDSCTPDNRPEIKIKDPRYICISLTDKEKETNSTYLYFLDFVLKYKLWQRIPVYNPDSSDSNTSDKQEFYAESFNSILNWLTSSLDNSDFTVKFRTESQTLIWSRIMASLYYFDKLDSFKEYGQDVFQLTENKMNQICALPNESVDTLIDRQEFDSTVSKLTKTIGMSRSKAISNHIGVFITSASFCDESLKQEYKEIKSEYDKAVEDIKEILKQSAELTLCWNSAKIDPVQIGEATATDGGTNQVYQNVSQVLNCAGEMLQSEIEDLTTKNEDISDLLDLMTANKNYTLSVEKTLTESIKNLSTSLNESIAKIKKLINSLILIIIIIVIFVIILFVMVLFNKRGINLYKNII